MEGLSELDMSKIELELETSEEHEYRCPFCDEVMPKRKMQFHVAIPLCMRIREEKTPSVTLVGAHPAISTTVPKIDMEYYGPAGMHRLLEYMIQRCTFGHPDKGKPVDLESFVDHRDLSEIDVEEEEKALVERTFKVKLAKVHELLRGAFRGTTSEEKEESGISASLFTYPAQDSPFEKDERREKYFDKAEEDEENNTRDN